MKNPKLVLFVIFLIFLTLAFFLLAKQNSNKSSSYSEISTITPIPTVTKIPLKTSECGSFNGLPDPTCTPGSIDPAVTQENIHQTICIKGYTAKVRPPVYYTNKLKKAQIVLYGYTDTDLKNYEEDHLISLELGGHPTDPKNLWPEPGASPNAKDKIENLCRKKICNGDILLTDAQTQISTDWHTACQ